MALLATWCAPSFCSQLTPGTSKTNTGQQAFTVFTKPNTSPPTCLMGRGISGGRCLAGHTQQRRAPRLLCQLIQPHTQVPVLICRREQQYLALEGDKVTGSKQQKPPVARSSRNEIGASSGFKSALQRCLAACTAAPLHCQIQYSMHCN